MPSHLALTIHESVGHSTELDRAGAQANGQIMEMERQACAQMTERLRTCNTTIQERVGALVWLPIWLYGYTYNNRHFRVVVNGQTGENTHDIYHKEKKLPVPEGEGESIDRKEFTIYFADKNDSLLDQLYPISHNHPGSVLIPNRPTSRSM